MLDAVECAVEAARKQSGAAIVSILNSQASASCLVARSMIDSASRYIGSLLIASYIVDKFNSALTPASKSALRREAEKTLKAMSCGALQCFNDWLDELAPLKAPIKRK